MLNSMRKHASGFVMKGFLLLIVLSFAVWGIGDLVRGGSANAIATVGNTRITPEQFRDQFNRAVQRAGSQIGRPLSPADARAIGLDQRVLSQMIGEATLDERARDLGLAVPDEVVANVITADENFRGPNGAFDISRFNQILRSNGFTEAMYVAEQRRLMARRQIIDSVSGGVTAPAALVEAVFRHQNERRSASYVLLPPPAADTIAAPDEAALQAFFEERKGTFQEPERRTLLVLADTVEAVAGAQQISDEELRARYEQDRARYTTAERRTIQRIPFPSIAEATEAAAKIAAGTSFEDTATARNVAAADLTIGPSTKEAIIDRKIADAAFALPQGEVSAPVQGDFSTVLLRVTAIEPEQVRSFEEVREELRAAMATEKATSRMGEIHDQVEDARASGSTLAEIAQKLNLTTSTFEGVDRQGRKASGESAGVPGGEPVLAAAFASDLGVENDAVQIEGSGYVWFDVTNVAQARPRTFEEARADVLARWQEEEARKALDAKIDAALNELRAGTVRLPELAAREGVEVLSAQNIDRRGGDPVLGQAGTAQIFSTPQGTFATAPAQTGARAIFQVTTVQVPPMPADQPVLAQARTQIADSIENDLAGQYVQRLQTDTGATVNTQLLATTLGGQTEN
ncbi:peptidylprolyl isomerase [Terrihabitans rhizophilus]|uniref:Parvulin-like PPIase n=1 Tax=Terrihabitans rhizophilus TaxID=3092662 RepID=A0ABU4RKL5_9HYPH|nr:SurA N-terminal domain-containing protein [Terrihabitans sp. PJ23]MDX6805384.1 SurA N-terminal domain-containing protein [Terrihabitans sp. PJ23]